MTRSKRQGSDEDEYLTSEEVYEIINDRAKYLTRLQEDLCMNFDPDEITELMTKGLRPNDDSLPQEAEAYQKRVEEMYRNRYDLRKSQGKIPNRDGDDDNNLLDQLNN